MVGENQIVKQSHRQGQKARHTLLAPQGPNAEKQTLARAHGVTTGVRLLASSKKERARQISSSTSIAQVGQRYSAERRVVLSRVTPSALLFNLPQAWLVVVSLL